MERAEYVIAPVRAIREPSNGLTLIYAAARSRTEI
jgi:hypothetical protein